MWQIDVRASIKASPHSWTVVDLSVFDRPQLSALIAVSIFSGCFKWYWQQICRCLIDSIECLVCCLHHQWLSQMVLATDLPVFDRLQLSALIAASSFSGCLQWYWQRICRCLIRLQLSALIAASSFNGCLQWYWQQICRCLIDSS